ncbi:MAG: methylmalonyl Co-A mutase-associated GTPase MeaB, partial [Candidatus Marinimicrobia bacterium]|nr:methylmalonyl Co-A mutase-associated GTPase MeaB [Candidatus Neomarinimicrobiota bacterium]
PQILRCSALEKRGIDKIWDSVKSFRKALQNSGEWEKQRRSQTGKWMWSLVEEGLLTNFRNHPSLQKQIPELEKEVESGNMLPTTAARILLDSWQTQSK